MRTEEDSLGQVKIPKEVYYGATTARALKNFQISGRAAPNVFREALGLVKLAAAQSNSSLKELDPKLAKAIIKAAEEFIAGKFNQDFSLDVFQAGAGTSYNMNANEIIANRANESLKASKGSYKHVHPNNHVNMAQSTNDVIPTATRIASLLSLPPLLKALSNTEEALKKIAKKHAKLIKVGRTHNQDAVPISLGQEFDSYAEAIRKSREFIEERSQELQILGIGGTAVGTGINAHPKYASKMVKNLSDLTGIEFKEGKNLTEMANNMNAFLNFSSSLRALSTNILNLCHDLKFMNSGPKAGLGEISLPPVQAGSSIMPGKINPSIPECMEMICLQAMGNDQVIALAAQKSQLELNVYCPLIMSNLLSSMEILTNGLNMLCEYCLNHLQVNEKRIEELLDNSLCTATALAPVLGYALTADIVKCALKHKHTIKEEVLSRKLLSESQVKKLL